jgi:hypothetical protein
MRAEALGYWGVEALGLAVRTDDRFPTPQYLKASTPESKASGASI